jgi:sec-independent protein translocase protein TatB
MFGLSVEKVLFLAILGAFLAGPERLPKFAMEAARFLQKMRGLSSRALSEFKEQLGPEFENLDVTDLNPRRFIAKNLDEIAGSVQRTIEPAAVDIAMNIKPAQIDPDLL